MESTDAPFTAVLTIDPGPVVDDSPDPLASFHAGDELAGLLARLRPNHGVDTLVLAGDVRLPRPPDRHGDDAPRRSAGARQPDAQRPARDRLGQADLRRARGPRRRRHPDRRDPRQPRSRAGAPGRAGDPARAMRPGRRRPAERPSRGQLRNPRATSTCSPPRCSTRSPSPSARKVRLPPSRAGWPDMAPVRQARSRATAAAAPTSCAALRLLGRNGTAFDQTRVDGANEAIIAEHLPSGCGARVVIAGTRTPRDTSASTQTGPISTPAPGRT